MNRNQADQRTEVQGMSVPAPAPASTRPGGSGDSSQPPRSLPPVVPSLAPPIVSVVPESAVDLSATHRWLTDPRLALLRRSVSDEHLVLLHRWGIDSTWTTNQIVGHVHAALEKKADRKIFESHLVQCQDKAALVKLVYATLTAQSPEAAERHARMRGRSH